MARKIRFALKLQDGTEARTMEELQAHFDLESVLSYFVDGRLYTWLADRYYDDKAEAVNALSADMPDLNQKLCDIFGVEYQGESTEDLEVIQRRKEKLAVLSAVTDNKEILDNIDLVAMNQDDLFDILDESPERVYLYGNKFSIPFGKGNVIYIGVNNPLVSLEKSILEYKAKNIRVEKVRFDEKSYYDYAEQLFITGKQKEAFSLIEQAANNGNPRAMYVMALYYSGGYNVVKIDTKIRNSWCEKAFEYNEPLSMFGYAQWVLSDKIEEQAIVYQQIFNKIKDLAELGNAIAQDRLGFMYDTGKGVPQDNTKAVEWYRKAAEQGYANAQCNLGVMLLKDNAKAVEWCRKATEQGYANAQYNLGIMYVNGERVPKDNAKAVEWYRKAAEQGHADAQWELGRHYENGEGVSQDDTKAAEWYHKVAEQGVAKAQLKLSNMYSVGRGVPQDAAKSLEWYRKSITLRK